MSSLNLFAKMAHTQTVLKAFCFFLSIIALILLLCVLRLSSRDPYFVVLSKDGAKIMTHVRVDTPQFEEVVGAFLKKFVEAIYEKKDIEDISSSLTPPLYSGIKSRFKNQIGSKNSSRAFLSDFRWEPYEKSENKFAAEGRVIIVTDFKNGLEVSSRKIILLLEKIKNSEENPYGLIVHFLKETIEQKN